MVAAQVVQRARAYADDTLARLAGALAEAAAAAADLAEQRRLQRESRGGDADNPFDEIADAAVHQFHDDLSGVVKYGAAVRDPRLPRLRQLVERHFPGGVGAITAARYETQLMRMERLVADLRGPSADLVDQLSWGFKVQAIESAIEPYRAALGARQRVTGGDVRAAEDEMHFALCRLLAYVLWAYAERPVEREGILAPVDDQQDRIAALMRARRNGRAGPVDEAAVADEADALEGPVDALSPEEQAQAEADASADGIGPEAVRVEQAPAGAPAMDEVSSEGPARPALGPIDLPTPR